MDIYSLWGGLYFDPDLRPSHDSIPNEIKYWFLDNIYYPICNFVDASSCIYLG